jgi:hypothetical protein
VAHLSRRVLCKCLLDGDEVLERLAHLEPLDVQVPSVQEVVDPLPGQARPADAHSSSTASSQVCHRHHSAAKVSVVHANVSVVTSWGQIDSTTAH